MSPIQPRGDDDDASVRGTDIEIVTSGSLPKGEGVPPQSQSAKYN